jgi:hypothetical protein
VDGSLGVKWSKLFFGRWLILPAAALEAREEALGSKLTFFLSIIVGGGLLKILEVEPIVGLVPPSPTCLSLFARPTPLKGA